jgi:hypothetical protein
MGIPASFVIRWINPFKFFERIGKGIAVVKTTFEGYRFDLEIPPRA